MKTCTQSAACPTHLTWEKIFPSRTSVPPLPTEPLPHKQYHVWNCIQYGFSERELLWHFLEATEHTLTPSKVQLVVLSEVDIPSVKWYGPKAGSTVSLSPMVTRRRSPRKKQNTIALQCLITCCIHVLLGHFRNGKSAHWHYFSIWYTYDYSTIMIHKDSINGPANLSI